MGIGIPMQVVKMRGASALCLYRGETSLIDTTAVGAQPPGTWLLVFLDSAREVISAETARQMAAEMETTRLALQGESAIDRWFEHLTDNNPEKLPEFLKS
ncbi:HypC/HybG/HupF family hydrogenase formation chaperone [Methylomonas sp. MgM2]